MTKAFINGFAPRQAVGVHYKVLMFGREAMYQGSFNAYQSAAGNFSTYDSKLVENGGIIFDPTDVDAQAAAWDEAWDSSLSIMGG